MKTRRHLEEGTKAGTDIKFLNVRTLNYYYYYYYYNTRHPER
jgi:hypothetical protein